MIRFEQFSHAQPQVGILTDILQQEIIQETAKLYAEEATCKIVHVSISPHVELREELNYMYEVNSADSSANTTCTCMYVHVYTVEFCGHA